MLALATGARERQDAEPFFVRPLEALDRPNASQPRHVDVDQDHGGWRSPWAVGELLERVASIGKGRTPIATVGERVGEHLDDRRIVLDDHHVHRLGGRGGLGR